MSHTLGPPATRGGAGLPPRQRSAYAEPSARGLRRCVTLLLLSALAPGSAQLARGHRGVGRAALRGWAGLLAVAGLLLVVGLVSREAVLRLLVSPPVLLVGRVLLPLLALAWAALLVDAWRLGSPDRLPRPHRSGVAGLLALLLVAGTGPVALAAHYAGVQYDLVTTVFSDGEVVTSDGRMNVLLLGGDAGAGRVGLRPDSISLASVDVASGEAALLSLPRNLRGGRFPDGSPLARTFPGGFPDLLNAVYTYGVEHPELVPGAADPGVVAMEQAVAGTLGLPVHYYVLADLQGFRDLVDALGGITVQVADRVPIGGGTSPVTGWIEPGLRRLNGYHALWYSRSREGSSDYARMARQRCVLAALARQVDPGTLLRRFGAVAGSAGRLVRTDLPRQALPGLVELALRGRDKTIRSVQFVPPLVDTADPDVAALRELAARALEGADTDVRRPRATDRTAARSPVPEPAHRHAGRPGDRPVDAEATCTAG